MAMNEPGLFRRSAGRIILAVTLLLAASPAAAWWEYGHQTVARIAMMQVRPSTRAAIAQLLSRSGLLETPTCPARTPEEASVWPDCVKSLGDRFSYTSSWHYQNVDVCRPFDLVVPCANGNCVSAQITRDLRLLKDRRIPVRERVEALIFLIHFVGDLHMPLHAGDRGDLGGNRFRAAYGGIASNLHTIWDGLLADRGISAPPAEAAGLLGEVPADRRSTLASGTLTDWSRESWEVARVSGYGALMSNPCGPVPHTPPVMGEAEVTRLIPVLRLQVVRAGIRLARLLDTALG
jgi:S1/P1 Nuclease